jgi:hypothetical protein
MISISASAQVPSYVPTNGLVGYWPFNGNANDASGNGYNLINYNVTYGNDKSQAANASAYFSGNGSYLKSQTSFSQFTTSPKQSYSFWFKNVSSNWRYIINYANSTSCRIGIVPNTLASTKSVGLIATTGCCPIQSSCGIGTFNTAGLDAGWHHIVVSIDISNYSVFYDGTLVSTQTHSGFNCVDSSFRFQLGKECFGANYYNMYLDDIAVWSRNLTQSEVTALYNQAPTSVLPSNIPTAGLVAYYPFNGNANDASGNGNNGTALGGVTNSTDRFGTLNAAYSLDGVNDYIEINNNILSQINGKSALSISYWFNTTSTESGAIWGHGANNNGAVGANTGLASGYYNGVINSGNYTGCCAFYSNPISPYSTWHQATVVFDSTQPNNSKIKIYIDGSLNTSFIGTPNNTTGNGTSIFIGRRNTDFSTYGDYFGGLLDDIGIWNRALTQSEITALYNTQTAAASDSLWVINKQTDTLAFPSQVKLSLKSNNITSKNISAYDIKLNYDASKLKFDSVTKTNTASANGSVIVNSATTGQVIIGWASSSSISSATLPLLNLFFTPIDSGKTTVSIANAIFNTDTVKNRYSKSVVNKFIFGDVDMNKIIQSYDASVVLKYSIGIDPLPTIDPLPWEPWRIKVASVDSAVAVDANDASLILKYSVGIITKFPKRGMVSAPGYVTVNLENNELVVRSFEDMGGLNITFLDHLSDLGTPTYVHNTNALSAFNKQANTYKIGVAFSEAPINGTVILRIPYTGLGSQTLNMELVENTAARNYQLNVVTGINDIKNSNIKIYPNPTNNIINIEGLNKNENNTIQIFDVQGKLVITKNITEKGTVDLSELNKGVYVIKIGEIAQRIVKM